MFCPNCGTKNDDDAVFCENCGTRIMEENQIPPQQPAVNLAKETSQNVAGALSTPGTQSLPGMQNTAAGQPPQAASFKLSKKMIALIAAVAAVIVAVIVFVSVGKSVTDYKKLAVRYVKAVEEGNWDRAYSLMNLPESEFLTKEAFIKVNEEESAATVINITAQDVSALKEKYDADAALGSKVVAVTYSCPGASSKSKYVNLDKMDSKAMLFFDSYKVSSDGVVAFDSVLKVPSGSKLYINGTEVNRSYMSDNKSTEKIDYYVIPFLFQGDNEVKVVSEYAKDIEEVVNFYGTGDIYSVSSSQLIYKSDMVEAAKNQAKQDLEKIVPAAVEQKKFSDVGLNCLASAETTLSNYYTKNILGDCHSSYRDVKSLSLANVSVKESSSNVYTDSSDGLPYIRITASYGLTGSYIYKYNNETREGRSSAASASFSYKYNNGQWQLYKMSLSLYIS